MKHGTDQPHGRDFEMYNGCNIAVIFDLASGSRVLRGTAASQHDPDYGRILRITPHERSPGNPELIIVESQWKGALKADRDYGCDYAIHLKADSAATR